MTPHRASNIGGGSYEPYDDSPYQPTNPKHSVRRGQRSSLGRQLPETLARAFENDDTANASAHHKHRPAQTSSASKEIYPPRGPNSPYYVDRMYDWSLYIDHDRNHGNDLPTLRKKKAALDAQLQARSLEGRPYDETDHENAEAIVILFEIESDIARLEGEGGDISGKVRDGRGGDGTSTGGMGLNRNRSSVGGRARQETHGHRGSSELPKSSNNQAAVNQGGRHSRCEMTEDDIAAMGFISNQSRAEGRAQHDMRGHRGSSEVPKRSSNPAAAGQAGRGPGHASRHELTEDNIASTTRDFSNHGVRSRESGKTPRTPRHYDVEDHAGEASRGHRGSSELPKRSNNQAAVRQAGGRHLDGSEYTSRHEIMTEDDIAPPTRDFSRLGVRSRESGKTPRHHDFEDLHADGASEHRSRQPLSGRPLSSRYQPSEGHARSSSRYPAHESGAPSRHHDSEDPSNEAFDYHQPRGSLSGRRRHQPSAGAGHGRSSNGYLAHELGAPPRHQDSEDYATGEPDYQPRRSLGRRPQPSERHGRSSGRHSTHESGAPSRHLNSEEYATREPNYRPHGSLSSRRRHQPSAGAGHGRSFFGRVVDYYSSH